MKTIVKSDKGGWWVSFDYAPYILTEIKLIPGRSFDYLSKQWHIPASSEKYLRDFATRFNFNFQGEETPAIFKNFNYNIAEMPTLKIDIQQYLKMQLFDFQTKGVQYIIDKKRLIVGDQPGLGKTAQAIAAITAVNAFPCLVICPSSLKINWKREIEQWTSKRALILDDSVKKTFHILSETNMFQFFIVNYESLKKYFVNEIEQKTTPDGKPAPLRLNNIKFSNKINIFKSVVIDESHRCLTYDNKILTNKGWIKIGKIVEKNRKNLLVASYNLSENIITFEKILNVYKNERNERELRTINAGNRSITATEDHKIYVDGCGWKKALSVQNRENLYCLREIIFNEKIGQKYGNLLREKLRFYLYQFTARNSGKNEHKQEETQTCENMRVVRERIYPNKQSLRQKERSFLFSKLFCKMASKTTRNDSNSEFGTKEREKQNFSNRTNERHCITQNALGKNETEQSNEECRNFEKSIKINERQKICNSWWQWTYSRAAANFIKGIEFIGKLLGICCKNQNSKTFVRATRILLQNRYCNTTIKNSNRSRWLFAQDKQSQGIRQEKNRDIELVGVESNTRFQPRYFRKFTFRSTKNNFVYDLAVEHNHNYFANGILVHNCKDLKTQQTKFVKGITIGKEYIVALTGTPVVNKPKDLISQLGIIDKMEKFGGYNNFVKLFCDAGDRWKELNVLLRNTCFYRREKSDVLKELPAKIRQSVLCDISTKKEYKDCMADLEDYMKRYKKATDEQIQKSMRGEIMVRIGMLKNISARGKIADVVDYVSDVIESGEKIILFTHLRDVQEMLVKFFPSCVTIFGSDDTATRQANVDKFQKDPKTQLIICSIKAAGVGITLTASSRVAFVELPWHPADCEQCEDRAHRIGQTDSVQCTYFLGKDTIDEDIYRLIAEKRDMSSQITGAKNDVEESIINNVIEILSRKL